MILVSGAGGTIGSALLDELRSADCQTRAAYHSASAADAARTAGVSPMMCRARAVPAR